MKAIILLNKTGTFAQNKDIARDIRLQEIVPALERNEDVILDFQGISSATQSFIHALISEILRQYGGAALEHITFKACNEEIKQIISIVLDYMEEGGENEYGYFSSNVFLRLFLLFVYALQQTIFLL